MPQQNLDLLERHELRLVEWNSESLLFKARLKQLQSDLTTSTYRSRDRELARTAIDTAIAHLEQDHKVLEQELVAR